MNDILRDFINGGHVIAYLYNILIFTSDLQEHRKLVHQVLQRLREHHLYLKESKCFFDEEEIAYLGLIVGRGMVKTDPKKIQAVKEWSPPRNKKGVQAFIGFLNYYRRFIKDFSKIAHPLHQLTGNQPFIWGMLNRMPSKS